MKAILRGSKRAFAVACLVASLFLGAAGPACDQGGAAVDTAYVREIEAWHSKRVARLMSPDGYLAVVGLFWLEEGKNSFGSDPSNDLVFTSGGAPAFAGTLTLSGDSVTLDASHEAGITCDGKPVMSLRLADDASEGGPTVLRMGSLSFHLIRRGEKMGVRVRDPKSATLVGFGGIIDRFPVDRRWRIEGVLERAPAPRLVPVGSIIDVTTNEPSPGRIVFKAGGRECSLDVFGGPGDAEYWTIFADETNGHETYGGGRFLRVGAPGDDGRVVIDFNRAYNPPCAFSDYTTCPLPPPQNRLAIPVTAGEKSYQKPAASSH